MSLIQCFLKIRKNQIKYMWNIKVKQESRQEKSKVRMLIMSRSPIRRILWTCLRCSTITPITPSWIGKSRSRARTFSTLTGRTLRLQWARKSSSGRSPTTRRSCSPPTRQPTSPMAKAESPKRTKSSWRSLISPSASTASCSWPRASPRAKVKGRARRRGSSTLI